MEYIQRVITFLQTTWALLMKYWAPISERISAWTAPIRSFFSPITNAISPLFDPLRRVWARFKNAYPTAGYWLGKIGTYVKYGFYFFLFLLIGARIGLFGRMPSNSELRTIQTQNAAEVYSQDSVLLGRYYIINRTTTTLGEISPNVVNALVATEDSRFYEHSGIDYSAYARVLVKTLFLQNESSGGGSTITQQLAKNLFPRKNYYIPGVGTLINKIQEAFIAKKLENIYDKTEIVNLYLNTVPFSNNVYGIEVAAKRFYNKLPKDLTVDEAAILVGMLKGTSIYDPRRNPVKSIDRRNTVMKLMERQGLLTQKDFEKYSKKPIKLDYQEESFSDGLAAYFRETLRAELPEILKKSKETKNGEPYNIYRDGLKIYTTIHSKMQAYAETAIVEHMPKVQKNFKGDWRYADKKKIPWENDTLVELAMKTTKRYAAYKEKKMSDEEIKRKFQTMLADSMNIFDWEAPNRERRVKMSPWDSLKYYLQVINAGFLAMDPKTGAIKAWAGGIDHRYFKVDHIRTKRQVGSTFKPIVYASALQRGISPCTYWGNYQKVYRFRGEDWEPGNSDDEYGGSYTMRGALKKSLNVISVKLILQKTPEIKPDKIDPESGNLLIQVDKTGINETIELAKKMGITSLMKDVPSVALGTADVNLIDMAKVYGTFANRGTRPNPYYIEKIVSEDGKVIYEHRQEVQERALTEDQSDIMIDLLKTVVEEGTGDRMNSFVSVDNNLAGKTGTTQNHADAWFMCFTPNLVCGAWGGADMQKVHFRTIDYGQGSTVALPICGRFLEKVYADSKLRKLGYENFVIPKPEIQEMLNCPGAVSDSTYTDSIGVRHAVPGSGARKQKEKEAREAEEKQLEEAIKEGINDIWQVPDNEQGIAYENRRTWAIIRRREA